MADPTPVEFDDLPDNAKAGVIMVREEGYGVRIVRHAQHSGGPSFEFFVDYDAPEGSITMEEGAPARLA